MFLSFRRPLLVLVQVLETNMIQLFEAVAEAAETYMRWMMVVVEEVNKRWMFEEVEGEAEVGLMLQL
jgi:hypothetical protein